MMHDLETAKQIASGDRDAAERFVRDNYASVFRLLRHLCGRREDAEDLTQQTFLTVRTKVSSYRGRSGLRTWIHRIAFNEYLQWKRRTKKVSPLLPSQGKNDPAFASCIVGEALLGALKTLPDKMREAFVLHEIEELSVQEVARILSVPTGTVKARLFHARRKLRALLSDGIEVNDYEPQEATL